MRTLPSADSEQVHAEDDQHNLGINRTCVCGPVKNALQHLDNAADASQLTVWCWANWMCKHVNNCWVQASCMLSL